MSKNLSNKVNSNTQNSSKKGSCPEIKEVDEPKSGLLSQFSDKVISNELNEEGSVREIELENYDRTKIGMMNEKRRNEQLQIPSSFFTKEGLFFKNRQPRSQQIDSLRQHGGHLSKTNVVSTSMVWKKMLNQSNIATTFTKQKPSFVQLNRTEHGPNKAISLKLSGNKGSEDKSEFNKERFNHNDRSKEKGISQDNKSIRENIYQRVKQVKRSLDLSTGTFLAKTVFKLKKEKEIRPSSNEQKKGKNEITSYPFCFRKLKDKKEGYKHISGESDDVNFILRETQKV